jgi:hypothetical protein
VADPFVRAEVYEDCEMFTRGRKQPGVFTAWPDGARNPGRGYAEGPGAQSARCCTRNCSIPAIGGRCSQPMGLRPRNRLQVKLSMTELTALEARLVTPAAGAEQEPVQEPID